MFFSSSWWQCFSRSSSLIQFCVCMVNRNYQIAAVATSLYALYVVWTNKEKMNKQRDEPKDRIHIMTWHARIGALALALYSAQVRCGSIQRTELMSWSAFCRQSSTRGMSVRLQCSTAGSEKDREHCPAADASPFREFLLRLYLPCRARCPRSGASRTCPVWCSSRLRRVSLTEFDEAYSEKMVWFCFSRLARLCCGAFKRTWNLNGRSPRMGGIT